jgi:hypothetical protein
MHLQTTIDLKNTLLKSDTKVRQRILQRLTIEEKQQVFNVLQVTQESLPRDYWSHIKGVEFIEYPDGVQIDLEWTPWGHRTVHYVSGLYETKTDAHNALELGLKEWNDLNESPREIVERVNLEDRELLDKLLAT